MKRLIITFAVTLWWLPVIAMASNPATTFTGTTVENVDLGKQTMSIKTKEGQSWTLRVAAPELLKKLNVQKGDHVSIEVDTSNNVTKIAKADESAGGTGAASSR
jgi:hypothetical protein